MSITKRSNIVVYTRPGCPDCAAVKRYLDKRGLKYEERDVSRNEAWIDEMKRVAGVRIAPVTVLGSEAFYGTFDQQRPMIDDVLGTAL